MSDPDSASRFSNLAAARGRFGSELVDDLIAGAFESDSDADDAVGAIRSLPPGAGWRSLDQALGAAPHSLAATPPALAALIEPVLDPPDWVEFELIDAGAVATWSAGGLAQALALTAGSLAFGYQSASLSRPLAATGRLTEMAPRRLGETARWVMAATSPGGMRIGSEGLALTVRLRLVHAFVRAHLQQGAWDTANWGVPLSLSDTLLTGIGGFFLVPLRALEDLGVRYSTDELDSLLALWRWISFLLGVPEERLPDTVDQARACVDAALAIDSGPDESSADLMQALLYRGLAFERFLPAGLASAASRANGSVMGGFVRRWIDEDMADRLEVPKGPLSKAGALIRPALIAREAARRSGLLGSNRRIAKFELSMIDRLLVAARVTPTMIAPQQVEREGALEVA